MSNSPSRHRQYYTANQESAKAKARAHWANMNEEERDHRRTTNRAYATRRRQRVELLKTGPCADCGNTYPPECMDFDHRPDEDKSFDISRGSVRAWPVVEAEIAKCELVCANCHRIRTKNRRSTNVSL